MASIDIQLSQTAYGRQTAVDLGSLFNTIERGTYDIAATYTSNTSWSLNGSTLTVRYADGAIETFGGFVPDQVGAIKGTATVTNYQFQLPNGFVNTYTGTLNVSYTINGDGIAFDVGNKGFALNGAGYATQRVATDAGYDPVTGNTAIAVKGIFTEAQDYTVNGTLSQLSLTTDEFLLAQTIDGNFNVNGNVLTDGALQTGSSVSGTMTGFHQTYADGSHVSIDGVSSMVTGSAGIDLAMLANAVNAGGNDTINVNLPETLASDILVAAGAGDDQITIAGGGGHLNVNAGDGNDRISVLSGAHSVDGGAGIDTVVLPMARAGVSVVRDAATGTVTVSDSTGTVDVLNNVERIQFSDVTVALDVNGNGGEMYRLYQAAFNRSPDLVGLGFWIGVLDKGASLAEIAQGFVNSDEFHRIYGANPTHADVLTHFYQNILHRAPDPGGYAFWLSALDNNVASVASVMASISESAESKAGLIGVIGNGFVYTPYHF